MDYKNAYPTIQTIVTFYTFLATLVHCIIIPQIANILIQQSIGKGSFE